MGLTAISLYAPGDIIASAWANILRTNFGVLDSRTGGDPAAAGKFLHSNGATSAAWVPAGSLTDDIATTGSLSAITTGTFGGNVGISGTLGVTGAATFASALAAASYGGGSVVAGIPAFQGAVVGASGVAVGAGGVVATGPLSGTAVSGTTGTFGGDLAAGGNLGVTGVGTFGVAVGSPRYLSNVADGVTPPLVADAAQAAVVCTNVRAASAVTATTATTATTANGVAALSVTDAGVAAANKDGAAGTPSMRTLGTGAAQAAAGNHTHASMGLFAGGTYSGNNAGTQSIGLAFTPRFVFIQRTDSVFSQWMFAASGSTIPQLNPGASNGSTTAPTISGASFVVTSGSGTNALGTNNYSYAAWG
jgi:hypothetical protein